MPDATPSPTAAGMPDAPPHDLLIAHLRAANEVGRAAMADGHHPFGALLVGPDHRTVLMTQGNVDTVNHAESTLVRRAAEQYDADFLWQCTLYTSVEPCCMCAGTAYWANIGTVVFGMTERDLLSATLDHPENPTLDLPADAVFARGQKPVRLIGPVAEVRDEVLALQRAFWRNRPREAPPAASGQD
jgi:tRNA(Arg) A34 adenosine deaminase TadA